MICYSDFLLLCYYFTKARWPIMHWEIHLCLKHKSLSVFVKFRIQFSFVLISMSFSSLSPSLFSTFRLLQPRAGTLSSLITLKNTSYTRYKMASKMSLNCSLIKSYRFVIFICILVNNALMIAVLLFFYNIICWPCLWSMRLLNEAEQMNSLHT